MTEKDTIVLADHQHLEGVMDDEAIDKENVEYACRKHLVILAFFRYRCELCEL